MRLISPEIANSVDVGVWADGCFWRPDKVGQTINEKKSTGQYVTLSNAPRRPLPKVKLFSSGSRPSRTFVLVRDSTPYPYKQEVTTRSRIGEKSLFWRKNLAFADFKPIFEAVSRPKNERQIRNTNPVFVTHRFILFAHTNSRVGKSHQIRISKPGMRHILFLSFYAKRRGGPLANAPPRSRI